MARPEDKRIQFLKQDGTDLFLEGDIAGATGLYVTAMQLETDCVLHALSSKEKKDDDPNNNETVKDDSSSGRNDTLGMNSVLEAVLEQAEEAIRVNPTLPKAYLSKATVLVLQNKWEEARDVYNKGINACENCADLRKALQKLYKTQTLLKSIPSVIERTSSVSSDVSECTMGSDGRSSPSCKNRRFRIQHRKKLSRPKSDFVPNPEVFPPKDYKQELDKTRGGSQENLLVDSTTETG